MAQVTNVTATSTGKNHKQIAEKITLIMATSKFVDEEDFREHEEQVLKVACDRLKLNVPENFEYTVKMVDD